MLLNYLKVTLRNIFKYKAYSFINIFGLSLGIACCILILSYIGYELSYDAYHDNAGQIYRLVSRRTISGKTRESTLSVAPVGPTMVEDFPEVLDAVRFSPTVKRAFRYEDKNYFQEGVFYADKSVFNVFSFELIEGDPGTALEVPFTMVLTESTAQKYFGNESPMGKIIKWDNNFDYRITGVVKNPPLNSHFTFAVLASFSTFIKYDPRIGSWKGGSFPAYLLLRKNTDLKKFAKKIELFNQKYLGEILKEMGADLQTSLQP
jgi:putative ABC transport system permease protein